MKFSCLAFVAVAALGSFVGDTAAQASAQANQVQDQAAALLSQARRCVDLGKSFVDRFAARASAAVAHADGNAARRGPGGEFDQISASLEMAAKCKTVTCLGKPAPLNAPNCSHFVPQFKALRINRDNWQLTEGLK